MRRDEGGLLLFSVIVDMKGKTNIHKNRQQIKENEKKHNVSIFALQCYMKIKMKSEKRVIGHVMAHDAVLQ